MSFWQEASVGVREEQGGQRQLTLSKGPERMEIRHQEEGNTFPRVFLSFFLQIKIAPAHDYLGVQNKKEFIVQVKNKPCIGNRIIRLFLVHWSTW
jgi:hypothetical protein